MKKLLMGFVAAACLASFAVPAFAQDTGGDKSKNGGKVKPKDKKSDTKAPEGDKKK
jgi:opacity protein-like surface antigen